MTFQAMRHQRRAIPEMVRGNYFLSWDPGTGKTYPALVAAAWLDYLPSLFIVPAHLRGQWLEQAQEHVAWRRSIILDKVKEKIPDSVFRDYDNIIVSYEYVSELPRWKQLRRQEWASITIDEAHYLMNGEANRTRAILGAKPLTEDHGLVFAADYVWPMTGTPFQFPNQIYTLLAALFPKSLTRPKRSGDGLMNVREWENEFCVVTEGKGGFGEKVTGAKNIPELRRRLEPFLDKVKLEDATDMKPLTIDTIPVTGTLSKLLDGLDDEIIDQYEALSELLNDNSIPDEEKLALMDESGMMMAQLRHAVAVTKIKPTEKIIQNELASGERKILVFGWHKKPLLELSRLLDAPLIYGDMTDRRKRAAKDEFIQDANCRVLIGQISSIGTGTDGLQNVCKRSLFMEPSWAFRDNKQCLHRLYRKGQRFPVHTSFINLKGSIDEYVSKILQRNSKIVRQLLD